MDDGLRKIELDFAEARKEIMQLRLENRKLETALTLLSKPMVLSDDDSELPDLKRRRSLQGEAVVLALPQGEALARIDALLNENAKLAEEIVNLRQGGGDTSFHEKNSELVGRIRELESNKDSIEKQNLINIKQVQAQSERDARQLKGRILDLEKEIRDLQSRLIHLQDGHDTKQRSYETEILKLTGAKSFLESQIDGVYETARKILDHNKNFQTGDVLIRPS